MTAKAKNQDQNIEKREDVELSQDKPVFMPAVDIIEDKSNITVLADMPGVNQENIDITLEDKVLTLTGTQCCCMPEDHDLVYNGYKCGIYRRSFNILADVNENKINASINNGVLKIVLPKAEKAKPKKITVQTG